MRKIKKCIINIKHISFLFSEMCYVKQTRKLLSFFIDNLRARKFVLQEESMENL